MKTTHLALSIALAATAILGGCDDLPFGDKTSVYYWSDLYLDLYADELVVEELEPGPGALEEPRVVLLIAGVTIREAWFGPLVARLERDGFVPVVYEPPELLSGSLFQASYDLAEVVEQVRADSGQDTIDILAECTGGVIARHYIQSLGGDETVSRLVTFVSPHHGIDKAPWAAAIAGWPALYDLSPGSAFLDAVTSVPLPPNVPVTSIYTCTDEYIQPWQGSIVPGATNIGLCDGFVGHFETFYDPEIYAIMHEALTEPLEDTVEEPEEETTEIDVEDEADPSDDVEAGEEDDAEANAEDDLEDESEGVLGSAEENAREGEEPQGERRFEFEVDWEIGAMDDAEQDGEETVNVESPQGDDADVAGCSSAGRFGTQGPSGVMWLALVLGAVVVGRRRARSGATVDIT